MAEAIYIFNSNFCKFESTLKQTSFDKENSEYLCQDTSQKVFNFDNLVKDFYPKKQPSSYDALLFDGQTIFCIEFKNQDYSKIDNKEIEKKLINGKDVIKNIFQKFNVNKNEYKFIYIVAYKNNISKWRRGVTKNTIQFGIEKYKGKYFHDIKTNDISFFTNFYKRHFKKELIC